MVASEPRRESWSITIAPRPAGAAKAQTASSRDHEQRGVRRGFGKHVQHGIDYGVAKAAVVNLSKSLAQEFGPKGIRVNCVSPGQVGTELWLGEHGVAATIGKATG